MQPMAPLMHNLRNANWFNPRPLPLPSIFRPTLALPNLYGGGGGGGGGMGSGFNPLRPHPPPQSPFMTGSSLMPISVRPFNFGPQMMGSGSSSYPVKMPFLPLSPFMARPSFANSLTSFTTRPLTLGSDLSFAESIKKYNFANTTGLGSSSNSNGNGNKGDKMTGQASHHHASIVSPVSSKLVPSHLQKPPIIVYQGIKPPVHVYKQPVVEQFSAHNSIVRNNNDNNKPVNQVTSTSTSSNSFTVTTSNQVDQMNEKNAMPSPVYIPPSSTPSLVDDQSGSESNNAAYLPQWTGSAVKN